MSTHKVRETLGALEDWNTAQSAELADGIRLLQGVARERGA